MVSVIIPNFNHAAFLRERIDSVLDQTYPNFELIILDDCSRDNSREVIETYREHPKVTQIIFNEKNSGSVFKQWHKGVQSSKGEFIWIAESDDYADRHFLEKMVPVLKNNPEVGFAFCNSIIVRADGSLVSETYAEKRNKVFNCSKWSQDYLLPGHVEIEQNLIERNTVNNASAVLFRKSVLDAVNPFDKQFRYIGDWYCYLKICNSNFIAYINKPLNYYREHGNNTSVNLNKNLEFIKEYFFLFDWILKNITFIDRTKIESIFGRYSKHSLVKRFSLNRLRLYFALSKINSNLFMLLVKNNLPGFIKERV